MLHNGPTPQPQCFHYYRWPEHPVTSYVWLPTPLCKPFSYKTISYTHPLKPNSLLSPIRTYSYFYFYLTNPCSYFDYRKWTCFPYFLQNPCCTLLLPLTHQSRHISPGSNSLISKQIGSTNFTNSCSLLHSSLAVSPLPSNLQILLNFQIFLTTGS